MKQVGVQDADGKKLPAGWQRVRLGDVCALTNGDAYKESDWSVAGLPIIRIQNLNDPSKPFNHWAGPVEGRVQVENGDLLLAWSGTPGTSFGAHIWVRGPALLNQHIFLVCPAPVLDNTWAMHAINFALDDLIRVAHGGVGLAHVTRRQVEALSIVLPPLPEQKRVTAVLRERMASVEKAKMAAMQQLAAVGQLAPSFYRREFANMEDRHTRGATLGQIVDFLPAHSLATDGDAEVHAATTACLSEMGFLGEGIKKGRMRESHVSECILRSGEVLVARSNTPELVGRTSLYQGQPAPVVGTDLTIRLWPRDGLCSDYLAAYLSYLYQSGYWREVAGGASGSMKKITRAHLRGLAVPVPAVARQKELAERMKDVMRQARGLQESVERQVQVLSALPSALLRRAFNGEL